MVTHTDNSTEDREAFSFSDRTTDSSFRDLALFPISLYYSETAEWCKLCLIGIMFGLNFMYSRVWRTQVPKTSVNHDYRMCCKKFSIRKPTENILELIIFFIHMMYIFFTGEEVAIIHLLAGPHIVVALVTHHHHILGPPLRPRSPAPRRARQPASGPAPAGAWPRGRGR